MCLKKNVIVKNSNVIHINKADLHYENHNKNNLILMNLKMLNDLNIKCKNCE